MRGLWFHGKRVLAATATGLVVAAAAAVPAESATGSSYGIWTIAGNSAQCSTPPACGGGAAATAARLSFPEATAVGRAGNVFIADLGDNEVREVLPTGRIILVAGDGIACQAAPRCGDGDRAASAELNAPGGVAVDGAGNVYVADTGDNEIRKITRSGTISRVAGTGSPCAHPPSCGDGGRATAAALTNPTGLAIDPSGNLYIADSGDQEVRKVSPAGKISRVAGTGKWCAHPPSCGDGGSATSARLRFPQGVAVGRSGVWYIADGGDHEVRKVSSAGTISTVAGTGAACSAPPNCGDGGPATKARLNFPAGVAAGPSGGLFIADASDNEVRAVLGGKMTRLAGDGQACAKPPACGDNGGSSAATLNYPAGVTTDRRGNLYVADAGDNEVRWLSRTRAGHVTTAGGPVALAAFAPKVSKSSVVVRFVVGHGANVVLTVRHGGHSAMVASGRAHAGFGQLTWNRRFRGRAAAKGRYRLSVSAAIGHASASSTVRVRL